MTGSVYGGLSFSAGRSPTLNLALLDERLNLLELTRTASIGETIPALLQPQITCAVAAPLAPNRRLMADAAYRRRIGVTVRGPAVTRYRAAEYELARRGLSITATPSEPARASGRVKGGWALAEKLQQEQFHVYPQPGPRRLLETHAPAVFSVLIKRHLYPSSTLEGRIQRQIILYDEGIDVKDPMDMLEEWTRHRFKTGQLQLDGLLSSDELNAVACAYTAYLTEREPKQVTALGDMSEGLIVLPSAPLAEHYL